MTSGSAPPTNTVPERRQQEQIADALADGAQQTWPRSAAWERLLVRLERGVPSSGWNWNRDELYERDSQP